MGEALAAEDAAPPPPAVRFLAFAGLAAFSISLPLVRILADAPEFFIAHGVGRTATGAWFAVTLVALPAAIGLFGLGTGPVTRPVGRVVFAALLALGVAALAQPLSGSTALFLLVVAGCTVALLAVDRRRGAVTSTLAVVSLLVVPMVVWVAGPSRTGAYLRSGDAKVADASLTSTPPIVVVVFDEFPLTTILGRDLQVNGDRFPNLAALGETADWFPLAASVSPQTSASVPALLSGQAPDLDKVPVASEYPTSIFALLGGTYEVHDVQPLTAICPASVCGDVETGPEDPPLTKPRSSSVLRDLSVIYRHAVGTDDLREDLPSISQSWAGFAEPEIDPSEDMAHAADGYGTFPAQTAAWLAAASAPAQTSAPQLSVTHLVAPHLPWVATPGGGLYDGSGVDGLTPVDSTLTWGADEAQRRAGYQRMLLQVGALDEALGAVRAQLEDDGTWDDALVVVTADHGTQFNPGPLRSVTDGGVEVTSVPLFIKHPGQEAGSIRDEAALTTDILPTILGEIGAVTGATFDGVDVDGDSVPETRDGAFLAAPGVEVTPDQSTAALSAAVQERSAWVDPDGGWDAVFRMGTRPGSIPDDLTGQEIAGADGARWSRSVGESGPRITISFEDLEANPESVAVACGSRVAGASPFAGAGQPTEVFVDPRTCPDAESMRVVLVGPDGSLTEPRRQP